MDQRKLIQHGLSSLTLALPAKWLQARKLRKGDSLLIKEEGNKLLISTEEGIAHDKVTIHVDGLDRTSLLLYIQSLYRFGYSEVEVLFSDPLITHHRTRENVSVSSVVHYITNRLLGFEIIEQTQGRILIKYLTKEAEEDFQVILRRIFLLILENADMLLEGIKKQDYNLIAAVEDGHDSITKFVSYALRLLNKYGYPDVKKTSFFHHIIASLDKVVDILKYNARDIMIHRRPFDKETLLIWQQVNQSLRTYYTLFYSFDLKTVHALGNNRDETKRRIAAAMKRIPVQESVYLTNMKQILEILLDLTEFRMGLEYPA
jgi:phosphate uptake regulator